MNTLFTPEDGDFKLGTSQLEMFLNSPYRLGYGLIFLCTAGTATIAKEMQPYDLQPHTKLTLLPGATLTLRQASDDFCGAFFIFSQALFDEASHQLQPAFVRFVHKNPTYQLTEPKANATASLFAFLTSVHDDRDNRFRYDIIRNQLQCLFWETYDKTQRLFEHQSAQSAHRNAIFKKFTYLLHAHFKEQRDVSFYAQRLCITPRYLSQLTRQATGNKSPKDLIRWHIILEIKMLLQSTRLPIQEIADQLNFPDQSYLGRYFKRYTGLTPTEYRSGSLGG